MKNIKTTATTENERTVTRMAEYIEREAAIRALTLHDCDSAGAKMAICDLPAADVAPVRHGRWLHTEEPLGWKDVDCMECSACHDSWIIEEDYCFDDMPLWNYCPSCGAKMDGGED